MINYISGLLGKNKTTYSKGHINKSLEQIYNTIHNYKEQDKDITPFINKIDDEYYLYGNTIFFHSYLRRTNQDPLCGCGGCLYPATQT
jgi:hypothetical protein